MRGKIRGVMAALLVVSLVMGLAGVAIGSQIAATKDALAGIGNNEFYPGETIYYEMTVSNPIGNTETNTLTRIWDTLPDGTVIEFLDPGDTLVQAPGETASFYAEYVVDADDAVPQGDTMIVRNKFEAEGFDTANDDVYALVTKNSVVLPFAELGDFVWNDLDRDGIQDMGEPGIEGWTVTLWSATDAEPCEPDEILESTMTDADGFYLFDELRAGKYVVQFEMPGADWVFTEQYAGADETVDSNADPATGITDCVELEAGDSDLTIDAGVYQLLEDLDVSKTVETSYIRTHEWDIDKWVQTENGLTIGEEETPKIWLYVDGSGDECATWYVDVDYVGYEDSDFNVSGTVTIENTGELDAVITDVEDLLGGDAINVDFGVTFPYTLEVGDTLDGTYDEDVASKIQGENEVTVTTERDEYFASEDIVWGDPDEEFLKTINVKDVSDLFGEVDLGELTAPNGGTFDYSECFAWADYTEPGPYDYNNTATIVETGQSASALLRVNWNTQALGDFVWNDLNMDGIQDAGEPGIPGVTVNLWTADELCEPIEIVDTMLTDADGYYLFEDIMHGKYRVQFVLPDGTWFFSPQNVGMDDAIDSDADPMTGISDCVELDIGETDLTIDAGMYQEQELCWGDETAWAFGGSDFANPNWDYVNNRFWGWTNGPLPEGSYEWDIYAGAGQNILDNGTVVGTLYVDYVDGCATVKYELDAGYYLGETHLWVGSDPLPSVKRGKTSVYTNAPGQFPYGDSFGFDPMDPTTWTTTTWEYTVCGLEGDIYVAAHSVVWMEVECEMEDME
jgi:uncharacterized repeat protein (TIGR01451 family)